MNRQLHLNLFIMGRGHHEAAWLHPLSGQDGMSDFNRYVKYTKIAETACFDSVFLADILALGEDIRYTTTGELEPITTLAALAAVTTHIGLVATASTSYSEPFNLARQFASLDHISRGRIGWNIVTSWAKDAEANFGLNQQPSHEARYERAQEYMEVVCKLWESWSADAVADDKNSGLYLNRDQVNAIHHQGKYFSVRGPLNIPRSPQGRPVFFQAGSSLRGQAFAAEYADAIFTAHPDITSSSQFYRDVKEAAQARGRRPEQILIFPGISPVIAETRAAAQQISDELNALTQVETGLDRLSNRFGGYDFSSLRLDQVLSPDDFPPPEGVQAAQSRAQVIVNYVAKHRPTLRQLLHFMSGSRGHFFLTGTPEDIADHITTWFNGGAADGFNVMPPIMPAMLERFADEVVPLLQKRGIYRTAYQEQQLKQRLGIA